MKFKEGDRVKVRDNSRLMLGRYAGKIGEVVEVERGVPYPYYIKFDNRKRLPFLANELEVINANPKI